MEKIQLESVVEVLRQQGMEVTLEQAKAIFGFLQKLAAIFMSQYLHATNDNLN